MSDQYLILDTGVGNMNSVKNIFKYIGLDIKIAKLDENFENFKNIIIPGVGAFDKTILFLKKYKNFEKLKNTEFIKKKNIIGICIGMHIFFEKSEEGVQQGLGYFDGSVKKFKNDKLRVPHMGWNKVYGENFYSECNEKRFYFAHSYYVDCPKKYVMAYSNYTHEFPVFVKKNNIFGIQFHPEKSNQNGIIFLKNLLKNIN